MSELKARVRSLMRRVRKKGGLPGSEQIVNEAFANIGLVQQRVDPDDVLRDFDKHLHNVWKETLRVLERYEHAAYAEGIPRELVEEESEAVTRASVLAEKEGFRTALLVLLRSWYPLLRQCFLSVAQSRKTRGGKDFELQVERLLDLAHVSYTRQEAKSRIDLIVPSKSTFDENPDEAAMLSLKRTLREREDIVAAEMHRGKARYAYLLTADARLAPRHIAAAHEHNIRLVVWDEVKQRFPKESAVLGYTQWANDHLLGLRSLRHRLKDGSSSSQP